MIGLIFKEGLNKTCYLKPYPIYNNNINLGYYP